MEADGSLTVIPQVGNVIKRLRVTPSADTSLARFASVAEEQQFSGSDQAEQQATPSNW
jgi:hypothetical protein